MVAWRHLLIKTMVFGCSEQPRSPYVVLGIPLDQTTTYKPGTRFAPNTIREAACNLEFYSIYSGRSLEHIGFNDLGDVVVAPGNIERVFEDVELVVSSLIEEFKNYKQLFILGGEHLITYPVIKALGKQVEHLVVFDAHLDLRNEYLGSKYNHATVMRRIYEELGIPITYIGARAYSGEEIAYLEENREIKVYDVKKAVKTREIQPLGEHVYVSIDMDVVDPSYAPGVSNPEPLGLTSHSLLELIYRIFENAEQVVGVDIVEVNPLVDVNNITSLLASKIILEIIGLIDSSS